MEFDKLSVILIDDQIEKQLDKAILKDMSINKTFILKRWMNILAPSDKQVSYPKFSTFEEASIGMRNHNYIFKGINDIYSDKLLFVVQMERSKSGNMYTGEYFGFTLNEDLKLFMLSNLLAIKIAEVRKSIKCRDVYKKGKEVVSHISTLSAEKNYPSLCVKMQKLLGPFYGFNKVFVLLYQKESTPLIRQ